MARPIHVETSSVFVEARRLTGAVKGSGTMQATRVVSAVDREASYASGRARCRRRRRVGGGVDVENKRARDQKFLFHAMSIQPRLPDSRPPESAGPSGSETPEIGVSVATELGCMARPNRPGGSRGMLQGGRRARDPRNGNRETWTSISDPFSSLDAVVRVCS